MPWITVATFGAVSAMRRLTSSNPVHHVLVLAGRAAGAVGEPAGVRLKQSSAMPEKPMSFPPMPSVTSRVSAARRSNCGGLGPGSTPCSLVMWFVLAPLQLASRNSGKPRSGAARLG